MNLHHPIFKIFLQKILRMERIMDLLYAICMATFALGTAFILMFFGIVYIILGVILYYANYFKKMSAYHESH